MYKMFNNYKIFSNGKIYSLYTDKYLRPEITKNGYKQITLYVDGESVRKKLHRIIAYFFCNPPKNYKTLTVNHIDGNKSNNDYKNLEWCTQKYNNKHARLMGLNNISKSNSDRWKNEQWSKKTSEHFSKIRIQNGSFKGKKNPRFRYLITDEFGKEYLINELAVLINMSYSATYKRVKNALAGKEIKEFKDNNITIIDVKNQ